MPLGRKKPYLLAALALVLTPSLVGCPSGQQSPPLVDAATTSALQESPAQPIARAPTTTPAPASEPAVDSPTPPPAAAADTPTAELPTPMPPADTPTPTSEPSPTATATLTSAPLPTDTPTPEPRPQTTRSANLRAGPGTNYGIAGSAAAGEAVEPIGRNQAGDWLQVRTAAGEAWIAALLVESVDAGTLPVRESTAPTVAPPAQTPTAPPPLAAPAAGPLPCGASLPAPADLHYTDGAVTIIRAGPIGTASWTQKNLSWRWDALDQVRGLDWYVDLQFMNGGQPGSALLRTEPLPLQAPGADGLWTIMAPGTNSTGGTEPEVLKATCPPGEPQCPVHVRVQIAIRDSNGAFACFISPPSNAVPLP